MENLARDLFFFMEDHCSGEVESPTCRRALRQLDRELDEVKTRTDSSLHDRIYHAILRCINEEKCAAFRLGLRLGLQLHTL